MATYFHGSTSDQIQGENLQTLYLMNPNYLPEEEPNNNTNPQNQTNHNMILLNTTASSHDHALGQGSIHHAPPQLVGIPLSGSHTDNYGRPSSSSTDITHLSHSPNSSVHGLSVARVHYNLWNPTMDLSPISVPGPTTVDGPMGFHRPPTTPKGLSLSLSPNQNNPTMVAGGSTVSNGITLGSKYLRAAQELLDEVVSVGGYNEKTSGKSELDLTHKKKVKDNIGIGEGSSIGGDRGDGSGKKAVEQLSTAQRQELQTKKAKLLNMLDEVEQRYKQYHTQIQIIISSFEQAAGIGSAKSYTSLALQTISRQFRSLKDAISSQIKTTAKSLGEDSDHIGSDTMMKFGSSSRLRFVDHQLRQQRALQQLGVMHHHNAWRPQRGLPERAVSVLRAWLFEHFLHPYPKDSDKHMLAKQTGLTRSQVSNWFINARVRLWKPMVEEMYMEEMKSQEHQKGNTSENTNTNTDKNTSNTFLGHNQHKDQSTSKAPTPPHHNHQEQLNHHHQSNSMIHLPHNHNTTNMISTTSSQGFSLIGSSSDMDSLISHRSPKKQRSGSDIQNSPSSILSMDMEMKPPDQLTNGSGFNPYVVPGIGRFNPDQLTGQQRYQGNSVSLTLGLPHCENMALQTNDQSFIQNQNMQLGRRIDVGPGESDFCGISMGQPSHANNVYDSIDIQSRKRFAAQLLHDFVA